MSRFWLSDETNNSTEVLTVGSTLFIEGRGLHPSTLYDFHCLSHSSNGPASLLARYATDRHGALAATPLIPYVGWSDRSETHTRSHAHAHGTTVGRSFIIRASISGTGDSDYDDLKFTVALSDKTRRVFACDGNGRPQTGIDKGNGPVAIALCNFPAGCVRVYLVSRQFGWRVGDPITPVTTRMGAVCSRLFHHDGARERVVKLIDSNEIPAGSYQFIIRVYPPGWHEAGDLVLLRDDVVSDRRFASLVVRLPFRLSARAQRSVSSGTKTLRILGNLPDQVAARCIQ